MNEKLASLKDPRVRQLAWACFAPPLIADFRNLAAKVTAPAFELHEDRYRQLLALDANPAPLHQHLAEHCRSQRLGLVYESLWHFFLQHDAETDLIAHNLPIREGGKTLGEFDVLYYCHRRHRAIHLELAVKYFMATAEPCVRTDTFSYWLGPNSRDRLDIKWQRMASHQLALLSTPTAQGVLSELSLENVAQEVAIKGWLFHHRDGTPLHADINPQHQRGTWWPGSYFVREHSLSDWRYLVKPDWLADEKSATNIDDAVIALATKRPVMLINHIGERVMLTPDHWPGSIEFGAEGVGRNPAR